MAEYRLTEAGRIGLRMLLDAESLYRADRNGLHLLGMEDVVDLPDEWVEPAPPPLPPEPEPGPWLIGRAVAVRLEDDESEDRWRVPDLIPDKWVSWAVVWEQYGGEGVQVTRLVPAPEPVTLPWNALIGDVWAAGRHVRDRLANTRDGVEWTPAQARAKAAALLTAADEAERASS